MQKKEYMLRAIELAKQGVGWTSPNRWWARLL